MKHPEPSAETNTIARKRRRVLAEKKSMYLHQGPGGAPAKTARAYDHAFKVTDDYRATLPDMMEAVDAIQGAKAAIQQVGVSGFKLPLKFATKRGEPITLEA